MYDTGMNDSESSANFLSALSKFSASLSHSGFAIYSVGYNMEAFGSWTIELGKRHRRLLVHWDGKDFILSVSRCEVADSRATKDWKLSADEQIDDRPTNGELFRLTENLILKNV
jgi:hypothetical protein